MSKFSADEKKKLLGNHYVQKVTESQVSFTSEFKILAVKQHKSGKTPDQIFIDAGLDTSLFLEDFPKKTIDRWNRIFESEGAVGLKSEKRGKGATGRPKKKQLYDPTDINSVLKRLAYLEVENDLLKKLRALEEESLKKKGSR